MLDEMKRTRELIERHEGREKYPYTDTTGHVSIGVGWNLTTNGLPDAVINELFHRAYANAVNAATHYPWFQHLNGPRRAVIVNMIYNLGAAGFASFKRMIHALERGEYAQAAAEMKDSLWAEQVGYRATELAAMMQHGDWLDD